MKEHIFYFWLKDQSKYETAKKKLSEIGFVDFVKNGGYNDGEPAWCDLKCNIKTESYSDLLDNIRELDVFKRMHTRPA